MAKFFFGRCESVFDCIQKMQKIKIEAVLVDATCLLSAKHFEVAQSLAQMAFEQKTNISKDISMEILIFLSCQTHANNAILKCAAKDMKPAILVVYGNKAVEKKQLKEIGFEELDFEFEKCSEEKLNSAIEQMALSRVI